MSSTLKNKLHKATARAASLSGPSSTSSLSHKVSDDDTAEEDNESLGPPTSRTSSRTSTNSSHNTARATASTSPSRLPAAINDDKQAQTTHNAPPTSTNVADPASDYKLRVTAGPSYDPATQQVVAVNTSRPTVFSNEFMHVALCVRIRNYNGLPTGSPRSSAYFAPAGAKPAKGAHDSGGAGEPDAESAAVEKEAASEEDSGGGGHTSDTYSIEFSFVPRRDINCENFAWGNDFDHPVRDRLPPGANLAFKFAKEFIDPGLSADMYADKPWLKGPALSCWTAFHIGEKVPEDDDEAPKSGRSSQNESERMPTFPYPRDAAPITEGATGTGEAIRNGDDNDNTTQEQPSSLSSTFFSSWTSSTSSSNIPPTASKRRKHFLSAANRSAFTLERGRWYAGDFSNGFIDFAEGKLRLPPVITIGVLKYVDKKSHVLRYVCKDWEAGDVYFVVTFTLLFGEEREIAERQEKEQLRQAARTEKDECDLMETSVNGQERSDEDAASNDGYDEHQHLPRNDPVVPITVEDYDHKKEANMAEAKQTSNCVA